MVGYFALVCRGKKRAERNNPLGSFLLYSFVSAGAAYITASILEAVATPA
jgi:hypothetical protein